MLVIEVGLQYYVVWNNKNTLYIDEKLSVQLGFVLITTGVILLFCVVLLIQIQ